MLFIPAQSNVTDSVLEVVAYEARRLFRDRLVSSKDRHTFDNFLSSIIRGDWSSDVLDNVTGMMDLDLLSVYTISINPISSTQKYKLPPLSVPTFGTHSVLIT